MGMAQATHEGVSIESIEPVMNRRSFLKKAAVGAGVIAIAGTGAFVGKEILGNPKASETDQSKVDYTRLVGLTPEQLESIDTIQLTDETLTDEGFYEAFKEKFKLFLEAGMSEDAIRAAREAGMSVEDYTTQVLGGPMSKGLFEKNHNGWSCAGAIQSLTSYQGKLSDRFEEHRGNSDFKSVSIIDTDGVNPIVPFTSEEGDRLLSLSMTLQIPPELGLESVNNIKMNILPIPDLENRVIKAFVDSLEG